MRKSIYLAVAVVALCAVAVIGQDDSEMRIRKALEGRQMLVKMDLPAVDAGVPMIFNNANVGYDEANYKKLLKQYGAAITKGNRVRITGVRISNQGIEIDLDGGGSPGRDWLVGSIKLVEPTPLAKSDREMELEHQLQGETSSSAQAYLRTEIEYEQQSRMAQDMRNREAFQRMSSLRSKYIEENRKNWGSKLIIVVKSSAPNVMMRDMVKSLAKYVELLPRETNIQ